MADVPSASIPTDEIQSWYDIGWHYAGPDFDKSDHSIMEWRLGKPVVWPMPPDETRKFLEALDQTA